MKPIHQAIEDAIGEIVLSRPHMSQEDILACFDACVDAVQPTILFYSSVIASLRDDSIRIKLEIAEMDRRFQSLFSQLVNTETHVN
jgi:hypothetical protein